ncbi:MAG: hypothetical protein JO030_02735 [Candidatus Eremiobacteraeota bacterium]|nr:hypothetical protein [Candidatus Eremiobacteraeota bacterium]
MTGLRFAGCAAGAGMTLALVAGCGGANTPTVPTPHGVANGATRAGAAVPGDKRNVKRLIYVSEWRIGKPGIVSVFDYQTKQHVHTLSGFNQPTGQCVDAAGDIWIPQADGQSVTEYPHGEWTPIKTLHTSGRAFGCTVSPSGDLAVGNFDVGSAPGSIQVFKNASEPAQQYRCPGFGYYDVPGYDGHGNLYVETIVDLRTGQTGVCELPAGGTALKPVTLNVTLNSTGSVMWDGKYITLTENNYQRTYGTAIYQATESPSGNLTVVGTTVLTDRLGRPSGGRQPFILGNENTPKNMHQARIVVGLSASPSGDPVMAYWKYPAGGKPIELFSSRYKIRDFFGESVSIRN